jgi:hypothetical protein
MIPRGRKGAGLILVFNNGRDSLYTSRRSRVQAINPLENTVDWEYQSKYFFSSIAGTAQLLPNNNVLITSSHGGRAFEIRPRGRIVWEWTPPFKPMRIERLPLDYCPQLAALAPESVSPVHPSDSRPFIDADLYRFALPEETERKTVGGHERKVVAENRGCQQIIVPPDAVLRVQYGIEGGDESSDWVEGRFRLWIRGGSVNRKLIDANIGSAESVWYRSRNDIDIDDLAYRRMNLCLEAVPVVGGERAAKRLIWANPYIESTSQTPQGPRTAKRRITEQERKLQQQQLKAIGYVD